MLLGEICATIVALPKIIQPIVIGCAGMPALFFGFLFEVNFIEIHDYSIQHPPQTYDTAKQNTDAKQKQ